MKAVAIQLLGRELRPGPSRVVKEAEGWRFESLTEGSTKVLKAQLIPAGRGSSEADWTFMGSVFRAAGVPPVAMQGMEQTVVNTPNAVQTARWT